MSKIIKIQRAPGTFYVYWTLTDFCNFRCNYCPPQLHSGEFHNSVRPGFPGNADIDRFLDNLLDKHLGNRRLFLVLGGGEPTLHPMYATIVERCSARGIVCTTTNGSRGVEWWKSLPALPQRITISLHPEFSKIDKINEVAQYLIQQDTELIFNLSCDPDNWDNTVRIYEELDDNLKSYVVPKVLNHLESTRENYKYTAEQTAWMQDKQRYYDLSKSKRTVGLRAAGQPWPWPNAFYDDGSVKKLPGLAELTMSGQHNYKGWSCAAGVDTFNIHFDGNVWSSICKAVNLGRIESFEPLNSPIICNKDYCTCPGDLIVNKSRDL